VDIVVTNTSSEKLIEGTVVDDKLGTLASNFTLNPGSVLELKNKCYDTFIQADQANTLPGDVFFDDDVMADARGAVSGVKVSDSGPVPHATAHCPLCPCSGGDCAAP
jgi:hypothetical protein